MLCLGRAENPDPFVSEDQDPVFEKLESGSVISLQLQRQYLLNYNLKNLKVGMFQIFLVYKNFFV